MAFNYLRITPFGFHIRRYTPLSRSLSQYSNATNIQSTRASSSIPRHIQTKKDQQKRSLHSETSDDKPITSQSWSTEWQKLGLGARLPHPGSKMTKLLFAQTGFGVDQHGNRTEHGATKAAVRALRNAIEFNSIPAAVSMIPGGRKEMLIKVKIGVPPKSTFSPSSSSTSENEEALEPMDVDLSHVAKVFPYGRLLPIEVVVGGLAFSTGRVVHELGDENDMAVCCAACVSIGYDDGERSEGSGTATSDEATHETYSTKDGY